MGNRLSKIYTRTGDDGTTGLGDGSRTPKDSNRIEALGAIDELNSCIGQLLSCDIPQEVDQCLFEVQHTLFDIGGEMCIPEFRMVDSARVTALEQSLDEFNKDLEPLKEFILPGGTTGAAICHSARSICRRAERRVHTLAKDEDVSDASRQYLNRLSDLLFVVARYLNHHAGGKDVLWRHDRTRQKFKPNSATN